MSSRRTARPFLRDTSGDGIVGYSFLGVLTTALGITLATSLASSANSRFIETDDVGPRVSVASLESSADTVFAAPSTQDTDPKNNNTRCNGFWNALTCTISHAWNSGWAHAEARIVDFPNAVRRSAASARDLLAQLQASPWETTVRSGVWLAQNGPVLAVTFLAGPAITMYDMSTAFLDAYRTGDFETFGDRLGVAAVDQVPALAVEQGVVLIGIKYRGKLASVGRLLRRPQRGAPTKPAGRHVSIPHATDPADLPIRSTPPHSPTVAELLFRRPTGPDVRYTHYKYSDGWDLVPPQTRAHMLEHHGPRFAEEGTGVARAIQLEIRTYVAALDEAIAQRPAFERRRSERVDFTTFAARMRSDELPHRTPPDLARAETDARRLELRLLNRWGEEIRAREYRAELDPIDSRDLSTVDLVVDGRAAFGNRVDASLPEYLRQRWEARTRDGLITEYAEAVANLRRFEHDLVMHLDERIAGGLREDDLLALWPSRPRAPETQQGRAHQRDHLEVTHGLVTGSASQVDRLAAQLAREYDAWAASR